MNFTSLLKLFAVLVLTCYARFVFAQAAPSDDDSQEYKDAYVLIFDSEARAKKAESLILADGTKKPDDLKPKELSLLCRIYNESFNEEKQMEAARILWTKDPTYPDATDWIVGSYSNLHAKGDISTEEVLKFVDDAVSDGKGNMRQLIVLKARMMLRKKESITDPERRVAVSDLLVSLGREKVEKGDFKEMECTIDFLLDYDIEFSPYFSSPEREALKIRAAKTMQQQ